MSKFTQQADAVQHLAKSFKAVIEMGEFLRGVGNLESHEQEVKLRIANLHVEEVDARTAKDQAEHELAAVKAEAADIRTEAEAYAAALTDSARAEQLDAIAAGKGEAHRIVEQAKLVEADVLKRAATVEGHITQQQSALDVLDELVARAEDKLATLNNQLAALRAKLD